MILIEFSAVPHLVYLYCGMIGLSLMSLELFCLLKNTLLGSFSSIWREQGQTPVEVEVLWRGLRCF